MTTIYDFVTLAIFAGLIVLFLHRSVDAGEYKDHLWQYLVAACGCAAANYAGNHDYTIAAVLLVGATLAFIVYVLRVFPKWPPAR